MQTKTATFERMTDKKILNLISSIAEYWHINPLEVINSYTWEQVTYLTQERNRLITEQNKAEEHAMRRAKR